jgi:hypothetical protein
MACTEELSPTLNHKGTVGWSGNAIVIQQTKVMKREKEETRQTLKTHPVFIIH